MVTIKDIAKELNLSYSTVSLALNASPMVSKTTMRRVKEAAREMGYKPNAMARALVLKRSGIIGIIVPDITNPFFSSVAFGAEQAAHKRGYNLLICNTEWNDELESHHLTLIVEKKIDGLLIASVNKKNHLLEGIIKQDLPLVFISSAYPSARCNFVGIDAEPGGYLVGKHLTDLGHREIAFVGGKFNSFSVQRRYAGFIKALADQKIAFNKEYTLSGEFSIESGYENGIKLLKKFPKVTATMAADDLIAVGMLKAMLERGIRVPQDFSIVGFDDIFIASLPGIELTTVFQEKKLMGELAMNILLDELNSGGDSKREKKSIVLSPRLVIRNTTAPPHSE
ncbi:MAG: LacI family transcriptional regulator [Spirochaetes bacterium]|nr:MAG: LacI family transcriptional regulator [Spirochaetota bacterium]